MGIRINTNVAAINTRRNLYNSTTKFQKSMEKLSSGLRINRAADDAADRALLETRVRRVQRRVDEPIHILPSAWFPGSR